MIHITKQQAQAISDAREMAKWAHGLVGGVGSRTKHIAAVLSQMLESASVSDDPPPTLTEAVNLATASEYAQEIARLRGEIERLRSRPCPYVTGNVTHFCTLTPLTLTDAERAAVDTAVCEADAHQQAERAATLRGLLERTQDGWQHGSPGTLPAGQ